MLALMQKRSAPVSYTHLDVYKRQGESGPNDPQDPDTEEPERGDSPDTAAAADAGSLMCMLAGGMGAAVLQRRKHSR